MYPAFKQFPTFVKQRGKGKGTGKDKVVPVL
jgi:hypothetical protein